jgi:hypothetical protein
MTLVERILQDIQTLNPQEQEELWQQLIDFEAFKQKKLAQKQKAALSQLIGIGQGESSHPDHDSSEITDSSPSVFDLAAEYAGIIEGPTDLSTNKRYLEDLGAS